MNGVTILVVVATIANVTLAIVISYLYKKVFNLYENEKTVNGMLKNKLMNEENRYRKERYRNEELIERLRKEKKKNEMLAKRLELEEEKKKRLLLSHSRKR